MLIKWNSQSTGWFLDAAEYTDYNKKLAELMLERMPRRESLLDLGCGMALADFAMADRVGDITCVDMNQEVISFVDNRAKALKCSNIHALCRDSKTMEGSFDTVVTLFHGKAQDFPKFLSLASDRLIAVVHAGVKGNVGPEEYRVRKCETLAATSAYLDGLGIKYSVTEAALEYGQPLKSMEDAAAYTAAYTKQMPQEAMKKYLEENLVKTGREDFPYYLPNLKQFAIYTLRRCDNEELS